MGKKMTVGQHYDEDSDVLYVKFGDDEPAYTENIDDCLLLDIGWFSQLPKGFRIVGLKSLRIQAVGLKVALRKVRQKVHDRIEARVREIEAEEPRLDELFKDKLVAELAGQ